MRSSKSNVAIFHGHFARSVELISGGILFIQRIVYHKVESVAQI